VALAALLVRKLRMWTHSWTGRFAARHIGFKHSAEQRAPAGSYAVSAILDSGKDFLIADIPRVDIGDGRRAAAGVATHAPGPAGVLPLTARCCLPPSGNLFGLTQNAGMGWIPLGCLTPSS